MAMIQCDFASAVLKKAVRMNVLLPQTPVTDLKADRAFPRHSAKKFKTVFLLHGLSDDSSIWCRRTSIERYADLYHVAVVMPDGGRSFYSDAIDGSADYWTFLAEELPETAAALFPLSLKREDCFAAGLSMGGYGAMKLGFRHPERFAAIGALSALADLKYRYTAPDSAAWVPDMNHVFGSVKNITKKGDDLFDLAAKAVASGKVLPPVLSICGSEDFMVKDNDRFDRHMQKIGYPEYHAFRAPGCHSWEFWDCHIQEIFAFFFKRQLPELL